MHEINCNGLLAAVLLPHYDPAIHTYADSHELMTLARLDRPIEALIVEEPNVWRMSKWVWVWAGQGAGGGGDQLLSPYY